MVTNKYLNLTRFRFRTKPSVRHIMFTAMAVRSGKDTIIIDMVTTMATISAMLKALDTNTLLVMVPVTATAKPILRNTATITLTDKVATAAMAVTTKHISLKLRIAYLITIRRAHSSLMTLTNKNLSTKTKCTQPQ